MRKMRRTIIRIIFIPLFVLHVMGGLVFSQYEGILKQPKELYAGETSITQGVAIGDVNGDGFNDIVGVNTYGELGWDDKVIVWLQDTSVTPHGFHSPKVHDYPITLSGYSATVAIADVNSDNRNEIVVASPTGFLVYSLDSNGDLIDMQSYTTIFSKNDGTVTLAIGDFNNDSKQDVVVSSHDAPNNYIEIFLQDDNGQLSPPDVSNIYNTLLSADHISVGNLNADNLDDIVISYLTRIAVFLQNTSQTMDAEEIYNFTLDQFWLDVGDINSDDNDDVVVYMDSSSGQNYPLAFFYQIPGATVPPTLIAPPTYHGPIDFNRAIKIADVNRDGFNDIIFQNRYLKVLYNDAGTGLKTDFIEYNTLGTEHNAPTALDFGDINGDGWGDVVFAQAGAHGVTVHYGWNCEDALVLSYPNGGQVFTVGSTVRIHYRRLECSGNIDEVDISYYTESGWKIIANGVSDWIGNYSNSYYWTVPYTPSDNCLVRVTSLGLADQSYYAFSIVDDGVDRVFVESPNGGDSLVADTTYNITWYTTGSVANVKLEYSTNNGTDWTEIIASTPSADLSYTWTVPNEPSNQCLVRISDVADSNTNDTSDAVFTIYEPGTETITVTAPNGGESITGGSTYTITWIHTGNIATVALAYTTDNGANWTTINTVLNTGSYSWNVPNVSSTQCRVRVRDATNTVVSDQSNNVFSIGSFGAETATVLSPNGGEVFCIGRTAAITWATTGLVGNMRIQYSTNNGASWKNIVASTANDGYYLWNVPDDASTQCLVRVQEASDGDPTDTSDALFSIAECGATISITSPKGGEAWQVGAQHNITWVSGEKVGNSVKLQYSTNNQATWNTITSSTANDGSYAWTIPNAPSTTCNVKIMDTSDTSISNVSFGTFAIVSGSVKPEISLNRTHLYYGAMKSSTAKTPTQTITVNNTGYGTLKWLAAIYDEDPDDSDDLAWIQLSNTAGTESGTVKVDIEPLGMAVGTYTGAVKFTSTDASNSPQMVYVTLKVYASQADANPFGSFDTPVHGSTVMSSIPVTGWALDDIGIDEVTVWRNTMPGEGSGEVYIGKAVMVEGPRPDVEQAYPTYPMSYKGGWGYMLLTNMLPNGGNGSFTLHAYAKDLAGRQVKLGSKTITCDNAHAVKPFGAIDTPDQGGEATGTDFRNQGWVLTPMPNKIPTDGSTIGVYIDGQKIGIPHYNIYRLDIATLFPGYANSNGAMGYLDFDTTAYESGVHTIQWVATDNAGNRDGIGSRYFSIQNSGYNSHSTSKTSTASKSTVGKTHHRFSHLPGIPLEKAAPIKMTSGYKKDAKPRTISADKNGIIHITVPQDERIVLDLSQPHLSSYTGYLKVNHLLRPLPPGASMDAKGGILYWQPGPASFGKYQLVFISTDKIGKPGRKEVAIEVVPKFPGQNRFKK